MTKDPSDKDPSFGSEAARVASSYLVQRVAPEICKGFVDHLLKHGELDVTTHNNKAARSRARNNYIRWAHWMELAMFSQVVPNETASDKSSELVKNSVPTDPIEAEIHREKHSRSDTKLKVVSSTPPPPKETEQSYDNDPSLGLEIDKSNQALINQRNFLTELCKEASSLLDSLIEDSGKLGISELRYPPIIITHSGLRAVLVRSITVVKNGTVYKCDYKTGGNAITRHNSDMIVLRDNKKLIRSNQKQPGYIEGRNEQFVKGMEYKNGAVYSGYLMADGKEQFKYAVHYQLQDGEVVQVDAKRCREVEDLLSTGQDPALSFKKAS